MEICHVLDLATRQCPDLEEFSSGAVEDVDPVQPQVHHVQPATAVGQEPKQGSDREAERSKSWREAVSSTVDRCFKLDRSWELENSHHDRSC